MPRYYFHLRDGNERLLDPQGTIIDDPGLVPGAALKEVRALISQEALQGKIDLNQRLEIEDESGNLVHTLDFTNAVQIIQI